MRPAVYERMRRELCDADERIATYEYVERAGNRVIVEIALLVPVERAAPVFLREFPGHRIAGSPELGKALEQHGAIPSRHAHRYEREPSDEPPDPPAGVRLTPVDRPVEDLLDAFHAGYHPGHVDVVPGEDVGAELQALMDESIPEASALAVNDRAVVGAILVDAERLILTVFRDPAFPGTGAALIRHALNSGPLQLIVTHGNPAERLYRRLGFRHAYEAYSVDLE